MCITLEDLKAYFFFLTLDAYWIDEVVYMKNMDE